MIVCGYEEQTVSTIGLLRVFEGRCCEVVSRRRCVSVLRLRRSAVGCRLQASCQADVLPGLRQSTLKLSATEFPLSPRGPNTSLCNAICRTLQILDLFRRPELSWLIREDFVFSIYQMCFLPQLSTLHHKGFLRKNNSLNSGGCS